MSNNEHNFIIANRILNNVKKDLLFVTHLVTSGAYVLQNEDVGKREATPFSK